MRRRLVVPVVLAAVLAAGCGKGGDDSDVAESDGGTSSSAGPSASSAPEKTDPNAKLPKITEGEKFGEKPSVKTEGDPPPDIRFEVLSEGDGAEVKSGEMVVADYELFAWGNEEPVDGSFGSTPLLKVIGKGNITEGWDTKIPGTRIGSRVMLVEHGISGDEGTMVFVIDLLGSLDPKKGAEGDDVKLDDDDLPTVTGKTDPAIKIPSDTDPPKELVDEVLIKGDGAELKDGQLAVVQYTGVLWRDGKQFDSSWDRDGGAEPFSFALGKPGIITAWNEGLKGKKVGSRVLLVVPPDKGYGEKGQPDAGIKGDDTMVFVVDIVGAYGGTDSKSQEGKSDDGKSGDAKSDD